MNTNRDTHLIFPKKKTQQNVRPKCPTVVHISNIVFWVWVSALSMKKRKKKREKKAIAKVFPS